MTSVSLRVRYEDPPNAPDETPHLFTETGSWEYVRPLGQNAPQGLKYAYDVQYKDGQFESIGWAPLTPDQDLRAIVARRFKFSIMVDGGGLDWAKCRVAVVDLTYRDDKHDYLKIETLRITKDTQFQTLEVLAFAADARKYDFHALLVPLQGTPVEYPPEGRTESRTGILLLETLTAAV